MILNRNTTTNHFSLAPQFEGERSTFNRSSSHKTTFNVGDIIPFYIDEVLPGDTFSVNTSRVVRLPSLITPVMDDLFLDSYYFFVPNRLVWEHWQEFCGENSDSAWIPEVTYAVPQLTSPASTGWETGTLADYFGVPVGVAGLSVNALPFRAYALICDEFFRNENTGDPFVVPTGDSTVAGVNTATFITDCAKGGKPFKASKTHDYFTSCLPAPQKGPDVELPLLDDSPSSVYSVPGMNEYYKGLAGDNIRKAYPLGLRNSELGTDDVSFALFGKTSSTSAIDADWGSTATYMSIGTSLSAVSGTMKSNAEAAWKIGDFPVTSKTLLEYGQKATTDGYPVDGNTYTPVSAVNLVSEVPAVVASINQLRTAFQIQRFLEKDARGGTRYIELLKTHFGVTSPDARLQRPEYLGGNRMQMNIRQVTQTSGSTVEGFPLGDVAGQSVTIDGHYDFTKSFVEHGFIIGLCVVRYKHTYQQGLDRFWSRRDRFDYYWPSFAHLGEMAVLNKEICATGTSTDDEVFGYQEAWADYRYKPNRVSGELRSTYSQSLDFWHFGDEYDAVPALSDSWMLEDPANVNRTLAVSDQVSTQVLADFYVECKATRAMPLYSVPGLIDHF